MQNAKFYFKQEWCEAISELPEELQGEVYSAIVNYILKGIYPVSKVARCIFTFLKKEFDKERQRLLKKSEPKPKPTPNSDQTPPSDLVTRTSDLATPPPSDLVTRTSDLLPHPSPILRKLKFKKVSRKKPRLPST